MNRNLLVMGFALAAAASLLAGSALAAPFEGGWCYDRGFNFASTDGAWKLSLTGYLRPTLVYREVELDTAGGTESDDETSFKIANAYLSFFGQAGKKGVEYFIGLDFSKEPNLYDVYIDLNAWEPLGVRIGEGYSYYSRSDTMSSSRLQFVSRDIVNDAFAPGRETGLLLHGKFLVDRLEYQAGIFNGNGRNSFTNPDDRFMYMGRLSFMPFGPVSYSEGATTPFADPRLLIAVKGLLNRHSYTPGDEEEPEFWIDRNGGGVELVFGWQNLYVQGEYFQEMDEPDQGDDVERQGFYGQAGYFVIPQKLELAARYSWLELNADDDATTQVTGGLGWFFDGHFRKAQLNGVWKDAGDQTETRIEALYQIRF